MQREDGSWLVDGTMHIDDFKRRFDVGALPREETESYKTLAGFVVVRFGHIPGPGEHFTRNGWRFEIVGIDRHRVDKVLPSRGAGALPSPKPAEAKK